MRRRVRIAVGCYAALLLAAACSSVGLVDPTPGVLDTAPRDAGRASTSGQDAGVAAPDASRRDVAPPLVDATTLDAAALDATTLDATALDAASRETSTDSALPDALALVDAAPDARLPGFQPGNLLVSSTVYDRTTVYEVTTAGQLVSWYLVPLPPVTNGNYGARDFVLDSNGRMHLFNGTFSPFVTTIASGGAAHRQLAGWDTVNNVTYGGLAAFGDFVYLTDMNPPSAGNGIVRLDVGAGTLARFGPPADAGPANADTIDVTIGKDGLLYALLANEHSVDVFDPTTMVHLRRIELTQEASLLSNRAIAVAANGDIFTAGYAPGLRRFDRDGRHLATLGTSYSTYSDIDLDSTGRLAAVGGSTPLLTLTDVTFATSVNVTFPVPLSQGSWPFVAWTEHAP